MDHILLFVFKKGGMAVSLYHPNFYDELGGNGIRIEGTIKTEYAPIMLWAL